MGAVSVVAVTLVAGREAARAAEARVAAVRGAEMAAAARGAGMAVAASGAGMVAAAEVMEPRVAVVVEGLALRSLLQSL